MRPEDRKTFSIHRESSDRWNVCLRGSNEYIVSVQRINDWTYIAWPIESGPMLGKFATLQDAAYHGMMRVNG